MPRDIGRNPCTCVKDVSGTVLYNASAQACDLLIDAAEVLAPALTSSEELAAEVSTNAVQDAGMKVPHAGRQHWHRGSSPKTLVF